MKKVVCIFSVLLYFSSIISYGQEKTSKLEQAILSRDVKLVEQLLKEGADPNEMFKYDNAISLAIDKESKEIITALVNNDKFLINKRFKKYRISGNGYILYDTTPIHDLLQSSIVDPELVKLFLSKGASVDVVTHVSDVFSTQTIPNGDEHPLLAALSREYSKESYEVANLVEQNVKNLKIKLKHINFVSDELPLATIYFCASPKYNPIITRFLERSVDLNIIYQIDIKAAQAMIDKSATPTKLTSDQIKFMKLYGGERLIDAAVTKGNKELVKWFIDKGIKVPKGDDEGAVTMSHTNDIEMIKLLLSAGAKITATMPGSKFNILQMQIKQMEPEGFEELIKLGADPNHKDAMGLSVQEHISQSPFLPKNIKKNLKILAKYQSMTNGNK